MIVQKKTEKNLFCEKLSALTDDERHDPILLGKMCRSLEVIIEADDGAFSSEETIPEAEASNVELDSSANDRGLVAEVSLLFGTLCEGMLVGLLLTLG